ncbi:MAG: hypothetical protein O9327_02120 [Polaromonas sp.]|nr:hypothetical protein [Polaromonas sp.]
MTGLPGQHTNPEGMSMKESEKLFRKIRKRLIKAKAHAAKGKDGAASRRKQYEEDLVSHIMKHGKPHGF